MMKLYVSSGDEEIFPPSYRPSLKELSHPLQPHFFSVVEDCFLSRKMLADWLQNIF